MPFDWKEYLEIAKHLQEQGNKDFHAEASFRNAVSRSYYSAFCHARNYAKNQFGFLPNYDHKDHIEVREFYKKYQRDPTIRNTHLLLKRLHVMRKNCDYDDEIGDPSDMASYAIQISGKILTRLQ